VTATDAGVRRRGGLFWHRDFRLLWIGQTTSKLGSSVTSVALPLVAVATLDASTAYQVYLPSLLDRDQVAEGNAKLQATDAAAQVGGPGVAGLMTQLAGK
jgi:hypothetical protein